MAIGGFALYLIASTHSNRVGWLGFYAFFTLSFFMLKLVYSLRYAPYKGEVPGLSTAVIVPVFNEDPSAFKACLDSIVGQSRPPEEIWIVDDKSESDDCAAYAESVATCDSHRIEFHVLRRQVNEGKRHAQKHAFRTSSADVFVTVDSDTILDSNAIEQGLIPMRDPAVGAVSGNVRLLNYRHNLLTRLLELRYSASFDFERAAYSRMDSLTCASGAFTLWRSAIVKKYLDDYINQTFLGVSMTYGDDRRLTNYCLLEGKVLYQSTAVAHTLAPEAFMHFLRQQVRWNKSFFRETLFAIQKLPKTRLVWWLCLSEVVIWLLMAGVMLFTCLIKPMLLGYWIGYYYLATLVLMSYIRSAHHRVSSYKTYLLAPAYALVHFLVLVPMKFYSLATLRNGKWGTRAMGVEVSTSET